MAENNTTQQTQTTQTTQSDTVPKAQYDELSKKVTDLETKLGTSITPESHKTVQDELAKIKDEHKKVSEELTGLKTKTLEENKTVLKSKGFSDDDLKDLSGTELTKLAKVAGKIRLPAADMGSGGGSGQLKGSPLELAQQSYAKK